MQEVFDLVFHRQYKDAIKRITTTNVNCVNQQDETLLKAFAKIIVGKDVPEFVEHLFSVGFNLISDDTIAFAILMDKRCEKSAQIIRLREPSWFSNDTFDYMHRYYMSAGMIWMIDHGFQFKWFKSKTVFDSVAGSVSNFYLCRERAKERAVAVLGVPGFAGGPEWELQKTWAQIIARVIWELRKFN